MTVAVRRRRAKSRSRTAARSHVRRSCVSSAGLEPKFECQCSFHAYDLRVARAPADPTLVCVRCGQTTLRASTAKGWRCCALALTSCYTRCRTPPSGATRATPPAAAGCRPTRAPGRGQRATRSLRAASSAASARRRRMRTSRRHARRSSRRRRRC
eukprot:1106067-Prymnesium_polylepis.1